MEMKAFRFNSSLFDDLLSWCSKLEALGAAVADLAWADRQGVTDYMGCSGQGLGMAIVDYTRVLQDGIETERANYLSAIQEIEGQIKQGAFAAKVGENPPKPQQEKAHAAVQAA